MGVNEITTDTVNNRNKEVLNVDPDVPTLSEYPLPWQQFHNLE